ncbi:hypothetical protein SDC9_180949 [bioreactor metagenome]|uniref:Uncharacterized protein n=1 Tax=bioreactor metagenome TaxID=1076179 RepID=A0A645H347_9ZZZZ
MDVFKCIRQRIVHHMIDDLLIPHAQPLPRTGKQVGREAHALRAARKIEVSRAGGDVGSRAHHGLHTGAARHGDAPGGHLDGHARKDCNLSGDALSATRG